MTNHGLAEEQILASLAEGTFEVAGQFVYGSNYTFLVELQWDEIHLQAVYKPTKGERPLWDFPEGSLAHRETAAFEVCRALGWQYVPPTVLRQDGPAGPGSLQYYVDLDPERHYFNMTEQEKQQLEPVVLFDVLINNADRKGGHVLLGPADKLWLIDHGLCFHQDFKLRTVIWDFAGQAISDDLRHQLSDFLSALDEAELADRLLELLSTEELSAMRSRGQDLLDEGTFPSPGERRHYPWPLV